MNVTEFFKDHVIDVSKLTAYGFRQSEEGYDYAEALSLSPMAVRMHYDGKTFTAEVIDRDLKETYQGQMHGPSGYLRDVHRQGKREVHL